MPLKYISFPIDLAPKCKNKPLLKNFSIYLYTNLGPWPDLIPYPLCNF